MMNNRRHPWFMLASIYITQYIGVAFILSAAVAILRQQGIALDKLALINMVLLPMVGKVLYAPIIDKYRLFFQGRYRSWLLIAQLCMALLLVVAGMIDYQQNFTLILIVMAVYVFFMSLQDVSVDGLACKLFDEDSRKLANSIQFSGNLLGNIIGGGVILILYPWLEWQGALWLIAALTLLSFLQIVLFSEPEVTSNYVNQRYDHNTLFQDTIGFIKEHKRWFLMMSLYPVGSTCGFALLNPILVDNGWGLDDIGYAIKIYGSIIGLISAFLATPLITLCGRIKALIYVTFIQALALVLLLPLAYGHTETYLVYAAITVHFISFPALLVISSTIIMDNAADTPRKATFFTLQFSYASFLGFVYSALSMTLAKHIGYSTVIWLGVGFTLFVALVIWPILGRYSNKASKFNSIPSP